MFDLVDLLVIWLMYCYCLLIYVCCFASGLDLLSLVLVLLCGFNDCDLFRD